MWNIILAICIAGAPCHVNKIKKVYKSEEACEAEIARVLAYAHTALDLAMIKNGLSIETLHKVFAMCVEKGNDA